MQGFRFDGVMLYFGWNNSTGSIVDHKPCRSIKKSLAAMLRPMILWVLGSACLFNNGMSDNALGQKFDRCCFECERLTKVWSSGYSTCLERLGTFIVIKIPSGENVRYRLMSKSYLISWVLPTYITGAL